MFSKLLVPLDQSSFAEQALGPAMGIATASCGEIRLVLAHEMELADGLHESWMRDATLPAETIYLRTVAEEVAHAASVAVSGTVELGDAAEVILLRAQEIGCDLIVMSSHGRTGFSRAWLGSVADAVIRGAEVPVLMLRASEGAKPRRESMALFHHIVVPLDGSTASTAILGPALSLARDSNGVLCLVRIVHAQRLADLAARDLAEIAKQLEHDGNTTIETEVVVADDAAAAILDLAKSKAADVIAMTTHGRGASRLVVGSVTDKVLRGSHLPILVCHPDGYRPGLHLVPHADAIAV